MLPLPCALTILHYGGGRLSIVYCFLINKLKQGGEFFQEILDCLKNRFLSRLRAILFLLYTKTSRTVYNGKFHLKHFLIAGEVFTFGGRGQCSTCILTGVASNITLGALFRWLLREKNEPRVKGQVTSFSQKLHRCLSVRSVKSKLVDA